MDYDDLMKMDIGSLAELAQNIVSALYQKLSDAEPTDIEQAKRAIKWVYKISSECGGNTERMKFEQMLINNHFVDDLNPMIGNYAKEYEIPEEDLDYNSQLVLALYFFDYIKNSIRDIEHDYLA